MSDCDCGDCGDCDCGDCDCGDCDCSPHCCQCDDACSAFGTYMCSRLCIDFCQLLCICCIDCNYSDELNTTNRRTSSPGNEPILPSQQPTLTQPVVIAQPTLNNQPIGFQQPTDVLASAPKEEMQKDGIAVEHLPPSYEDTVKSTSKESKPL